MAAFKIKNENGEIIEIPALMGLSAYQIALENGFEGTEQEWLESLKGGIGGIAINTAEVGQTIKVSAVDENGKPTAWEAVDFPAGGGSSEWEYMKMSITEAVSSINFKLPSAAKKVFVICYFKINDAENSLPNGGTTDVVLYVNNRMAGSTKCQIRASESWGLYSTYEFEKINTHLKVIESEQYTSGNNATSKNSIKMNGWQGMENDKSNTIDAIYFGFGDSNMRFSAGTSVGVYYK